MISFLKRKRFIEAKIIDHYLSNGRNIHQNYVWYSFEKYQISSIIYQIYQLSSNIIKYHQTYHSIYHNICHKMHQKYQIHEIHQHIDHIYITKYISSIFCWIKLFKLKGYSKGLNWLQFLQKKKKKEHWLCLRQKDE